MEILALAVAVVALLVGSFRRWSPTDGLMMRLERVEARIEELRGLRAEVEARLEGADLAMVKATGLESYVYWLEMEWVELHAELRRMLGGGDGGG